LSTLNRQKGSIADMTGFPQLSQLAAFVWIITKWNVCHKKTNLQNGVGILEPSWGILCCQRTEGIECNPWDEYNLDRRKWQCFAYIVKFSLFVSTLFISALWNTKCWWNCCVCL
jgi:hypothetical protein